jgi:hypothetical protein
MNSALHNNDERFAASRGAGGLGICIEPPPAHYAIAKRRVSSESGAGSEVQP